MKNIYYNLINYLLPFRCHICTELTQDQAGICGNCWNKFNFISAPYCYICGVVFNFVIDDNPKITCGRCFNKKPKYDKLRSIFILDQFSKTMIHAFKYYDKTIYANFFAKLLKDRYLKEFTDIDIIVPVPMHRIKRIFRYYNPSELLAKELSLLLTKQFTPNLLIKSKWTKSQTGLSKKDRQKNLARSIQFNINYNIKNKSILLIDDVHTTGATVNLCSSILKQNGAKSVIVATIAATDRS